MKKIKLFLPLAVIALLCGCLTVSALASSGIYGDVDGNGKVNVDDALYLMHHVALPDEYPLQGTGDLDCDRDVDKDDALLLLRHTLSPQRHPMNCNHQSQTIASVTPTCGRSGLTQGSFCIRCGEILVEQNVIPPIGHVITMTESKPASCTEDGYRRAYCTVCHSNVTSEVELATGHTFGEPETVLEASCTTDGLSRRSCLHCSVVEETATSAWGHSYVYTDDGQGNEQCYCQTCGVMVENNAPVESDLSDYVEDCPSDYSFVILSNQSEAQIRENLHIVNAGYEGTDNESEGYQDYTLTNLGDGRWEVQATNGLEPGSTFVVKTEDDVQLEDHTGDELTISVYSPEKSETQLGQDIIFIQLPNNPQSAGYDIQTTEDSDYIYLIIPEQGDFTNDHIGRIVCAGAYSAADEYHTNPGLEHSFGKIEAVLPMADGRCTLVLGCPELYEVFDKLDIYYFEDVEIDEDDLPDDLEEQAVAALYASEGFSEFVAQAIVSSELYAQEYDMELVTREAANILNNMRLKTSVKFNNGNVSVSISGTLSIPIKSQSGSKVGEVKFSFTTGVDVSLKLKAFCNFRYFLGIPVGVQNLEVSMTNTTTFKFEFSVTVTLEKVYGEDEKKIYLIPNGKYHLADCSYLANRELSELQSFTSTEMDALYRKDSAGLLKQECSRCKPVSGYLNNAYFYIGTDGKTAHCFTCTEAGRTNPTGGKLVETFSSSHTFCKSCNPDKKVPIDFSKYTTQCLKYQDWNVVLGDVMEFTKNQDSSGSGGVPVVKIPIPTTIPPFCFELDLSLELEFRFEGTLSYKYSNSSTEVYGLRYASWTITPFHNRYVPTSTTNSLELTGKLSMKAGIKVDFYATISGLQKYIRVGVAAKAGVYAELSGVLRISKTTTTQNGVTVVQNDSFGGMSFEVGIYADVYFNYKVLWWEGKISFLGGEKRYPLFHAGYDRIYYNYSPVFDKIDAQGSVVDLRKYDLLQAKYYNVRSFNTGTQSLNILGQSGKYSVTVQLLDENGQVSPYATYQNGKITRSSNAPCQLDLTVVISVKGNKKLFESMEELIANKFVSGSASYQLDDLVVQVRMTEHTYNQQNIDAQYLKSGPTCSSKAVYYYSCKCGDCGTATFESGTTLPHTLTAVFDRNNHWEQCQVCNAQLNVLPHNWTGVYITDETEHYMECADCDAIKDHSNHSGGTATCTQRAQCEVCQQSYGDLLAHNYTRSDGSCMMSEATCTEPAVYYHTCVGCGKVGQTTYTKGSALGHNWTDPEPNGDIHSASCMRCGAYTEINTPHSETVERTLEPTCWRLGEDLYTCTICGRQRTEAASIIAHCLESEATLQVEMTDQGYLHQYGYACKEYENCGYMEHQLEPQVHIHPGYYWAGFAPTCTSEGITSCVLCSASYCDWAFIPEEILPALGHDFQDGSCTRCGEILYSSGLEYVLGNDYASYTVSSIGSCTDTELIIPATYNGLPVTRIGAGAFGGCSQLTSVSIPDTVTTIENWAFGGCTGLTQLTIPDSVTTIEFSVFYGCTGLMNVTLPSQITVIEENTFYNCSALAGVTIPEGVTTIGPGAFYNCTSMVGAIIPESVMRIEHRAFEGCWHLSILTLPQNLTFIGEYAFSECIGLTDITIPGSVTAISDYAFYNCYYMNSVTIQKGVTSIGNWAFAACHYLTNVSIPEGVISIGNTAFSCCNELASVTIPESVTSIGDYAFEYCCNLEVIYFTGTSAQWESITKGVDWDLYIGCDTPEGTYQLICLGDPQPSQGLVYELNTYGTYYIVSGIGTCTDTEILIPETYNGLPVKAIGNWAFMSCANLTKVTIPESVISIGESAFAQCTSLTEIIIPESVTSIGNYAFLQCSALTEFTIPGSVSSMGFRVFDGCTNLTTVTISEGATGIGTYAFYSCTALSAVTIPKSITTIGEGTFYGCTKLETIYYNGTTAQWHTITKDAYWDTSAGKKTANGAYILVCLGDPKSSQGLTYQLCNDGTYYTVTGIGSCTDTELIIPAHYNGLPVKVVGDQAFRGCTNLAGVTIQKGIIRLERDAFAECTALTSVVIPDGVTSLNHYVFYNCTNLISVTIPGTVTYMGEMVFYNCQKLTNVTILDGVTSIGSYAFNRCSNLTGITIPPSVTSIGNYALSGCTKLTEVTIPAAVTYLGEYAFSGCTGLSAVTIPDKITSIGMGTFSGCTGLKSVTLPEGLTSIGVYALGGCTKLETIYFEGTTEQWEAIQKGLDWDTDTGAYQIICLGDPQPSQGLEYAVYNDACYVIGIGKCTDTDVIIPATYDGFQVSYIVESAFSSCTNLTSVTIPEGVTHIGVGAFADCTNLIRVTIPDGVTSIAESTFYNCTNLTSVILPDGVTSIGMAAFANCTNLTDVNIPQSVTYIGDAAFRDCTALTNITIPIGVTFIGEAAFCRTGITSVTIPAGVTSVNIWTFAECTRLTDVTISEGVTSINEASFLGCTSLTNVTIPNSVTFIGESAFDSAGLINLYIPASVTHIGNYAFTWCPDLTTVTIAGVTSMGSYVFSTCPKLTTVTMLEGVTSIGYEAFSWCNNLTTVTIPTSVTSIEDFAFSNCENLQTVYFEGTTDQWQAIKKGYCIDDEYSTFTVICLGDPQYSQGLTYDLSDDGTYYIVTGIGTCTDTELIIPATYNGLPVKEISNCAFYGCNTLTDVTISDGITSIGNSAFADCRSLIRVNIANSVTTIGQEAFFQCSKLTTVSIPQGVTSIDSSTFYSCYFLTNITIPDSVTSIGTYAFYACVRLETIHYYGSQDQWNAITKDSNWDYDAGTETTDGSYDVFFVTPVIKDNEYKEDVRFL